MLSKHEAQVRHAKRRAKERFDIELTPELRQRLIRDIQRGRAEFAGRQSNRVTRWRIWVDGKPCIVIYDSRRKSIVTFLDPSKANDSFHYVTFD